MTDDEFRLWLSRDNEQRCVLVELDYIYESDDSPVEPTLGTLRLSDRVFFDDVTNFSYVDCIRSAPQYARNLSGDRLGIYVSSIGTLELDNADGELDFMLNLACDGSQMRFYFGGPAWPLSEFKLIFSAITAKVSAPTFDRISVALKDTGLLLNKSIGGTSTVGGTGANLDRSRPVNFGFIHNLSPLVVDETIDGGKYDHSDSGVGTAVLEVRDLGVSVAFTDDGDGTFRLTDPPVGAVTCDVLAEPEGDDNVMVSDAMNHLIGDRAGLSSLALYDGAGPTFIPHDDDDYKVGISLPEARNAIDLLADICDSGNCFWAVKRTGEFTFGRLRLNNIADLIADSPPAIEAVDIVEDDLDQGSFRLEHATPQYYRFQAYMSRNWTKQTNFATSLTPDEQALYSRNGLYLLQPDSVGTDYASAPELYDLTLVESPVVDTLLSEAFSEFDLDSLAQWMTTRRAMLLPWVELPSFVVGIDFYRLELGDPVRLFVPRFGWDDGVLFQIIGITIRLTDAKIELRLARRNLIQAVPDRWLRIASVIDDTQQEYVAAPARITPIDMSIAPLIGAATANGFDPSGRLFFGVVIGSSFACNETNSTTILSHAGDFTGASSAAFSQYNASGGAIKSYAKFSFADGAIITDLHWTGYKVSTAEPFPITAWHIEFWSDSSGVPGVLLSAPSFTPALANETAGGLVAGSYTSYTYSVDIGDVIGFICDPGVSYWLMLSPTYNNTPQWFWLGSTDSGNNFTDFQGTPISQSFALAFEITGCVPP